MGATEYLCPLLRIAPFSSKAGRHLASSLPTARRHHHHPSTAASRTCIAKMSEPASKRQRAAAEAPKPKKTASNCTVVGE